MNKASVVAVVAALLVAAPALANNGNGADNGNKNGWEDAPGPTGDVPPGLIVSAENGREDNGSGNGGESPGDRVLEDEDSPIDQDPN